MSGVFYVYVLFRPWNGEPCYIGKGKGNRMRCHERAGSNHSNRHLSRILAKAGGTLPSVVLHEKLNEATAFAYEIALISAIGRQKNGGPLVNLTDGGEGTSGHEVSCATRAIIAASNKIRECTPETRRRMSLAHLGLKRPGLIPWNKGRATGLIPWNKGKRGTPAWNKGVPCSEDVKARISATLTGRPGSTASRGKGIPKSEAHRSAISISRLGKPHPHKGVKCSPEKAERIRATKLARKSRAQTSNPLKFKDIMT